MRETDIGATIQDATTLYAIYRKDLRIRMMNGGESTNNKTGEETPWGEQPATDKQKHYLMDLAYRKGMCITQIELDRMTKEKASKTIDTLLEGD